MIAIRRQQLLMASQEVIAHGKSRVLLQPLLLTDSQRSSASASQSIPSNPMSSTAAPGRGGAAAICLRYIEANLAWYQYSLVANKEGLMGLTVQPS